MEFREFDQPTNKTRRIETSNIPLNFTRGKIHSILSFVGRGKEPRHSVHGHGPFRSAGRQIDGSSPLLLQLR